MRAFGVFQGGGAKGYAHLGALSAAEDRGIQFERVAGTSAGAIVASLVACGYTSQELYNPVGEFGDCGVLDVQPFDVLGEAYRQEIGFARTEMDEIVEFARKKRRLRKLRLLARVIPLRSGFADCWRTFGETTASCPPKVSSGGSTASIVRSSGSIGPASSTICASP